MNEHDSIYFLQWRISTEPGFKDLLANFAYHFDYRTDTAYIDTRKLKP